MTIIPELREVELLANQEAIGRYAELTQDFNPLHVDPGFAATTEMGGVIAHGTLSLNLIWQSLEASLGRDALANLELDVRFKRPVRVGQTVRAGGRAVDGRYEIWVRNEAGEAVIEGTATPASCATKEDAV